ncbi:14956_t:CDS:2 [Acaulospora morrowiae]|uniref:14956_t:CDS:1 n=1 Tax=Acaulospora morrowiae TaxID=94023 RepID=A0A9N9DPL8_9GLOM|nr:14956_t:CDS:2 [Acaulospora morrowiae]
MIKSLHLTEKFLKKVLEKEGPSKSNSMKTRHQNPYLGQSGRALQDRAQVQPPLAFDTTNLTCQRPLHYQQGPLPTTNHIPSNFNATTQFESSRGRLHKTFRRTLQSQYKQYGGFRTGVGTKFGNQGHKRFTQTMSSSSSFRKSSRPIEPIINNNTRSSGRTAKKRPLSPALSSRASHLRGNPASRKAPKLPKKEVSSRISKLKYQKSKKSEKNASVSQIKKQNNSARHERSAFQPLPDLIYDMNYIVSTYKTNEVGSKKGNQSWIKSPRKFLINILQHPVEWKLYGPAESPLHRATVQLEISGTRILGHGDAKNKKEAERIAFLNACYMIEVQGLMEDVRTLCKRENSDCKKFVFEYCSKFNYLPNFNVTNVGPDHDLLWEAIVEFPSQNLVGRGRGKTKKEAELKASEIFKRNAEEYQAHRGDYKAESSIISEDQARKFIQFYCKFFKFKNPVLRIKNLGSLESPQWSASLIVENTIIGNGERSNKREAQNIAYLDAAISLRKDSPRLWDKFESNKNKVKLSEKPTPIVNVEMNDPTFNSLCKLITDIRGANMFNRDGGAESKIKLSKRTLEEKPNFKANAGKKKFTDSYLEEKSQKLYNSFQDYLNSVKTEKIRFDRSQLPITHYSSIILDAIKNNPVVVIVGSTGCGKTTQLPQLIFEESIMERLGAHCNIIVTQPRRIAAISVAQRVAYERSEKLGQTVGYNVRFDVVKPAPAGTILYCTTGIFLRRMHEVQTGHDAFEGITHIVVDEVHERDMNTDFMLVILKQILQERIRNNLRPIKLILMSATMDTGVFSEYFGNFFPNGRCPVIEVPGKLYPVQQFFLEDIVKMLRKTYTPLEVKLLNQKDTCKYIEREIQFFQMPKILRDVTPSPQVSGESTAMELDSDEEASVHGDLEDDNASTESSLNEITDSFGSKQNSEMEDIEKEEVEVPYNLIALVIAHIVRTTNEGAILVFLPGWEDITSLNRLLTSHPHPLGINFSDSSQFRIHFLHSSLPSLSQQEVFETLPYPTMRKIILATNIAETSITIKDIVYVIDSGKLKENRYDQSRRMTNLTTTWISQSNLRQRSGRAGRVRAGEYFSMMSRNRSQNLEAYSIPEIMRSDLQEICLHIKALGFSSSIAKVLSQAIQPPDQAHIKIALENLKLLQALDHNEELTPLGKVLAILPMEPGLGKMVLLGSVFQCLDPILTIAASMASRSPFHSPPYAKLKAEETRYRWSRGLCCDNLTVLNVYEAWYKVQESGTADDINAFCSENFLSRTSMKTIEQIKLQLLNLLQRSGVVPDYYRGKRKNNYGDHTLGPPEYNVNSNCIPLIRSLIYTGVYPNLSVKVTKNVLRTRHEKVTLIHPSSVNNRKSVKFEAAHRENRPTNIHSNNSLFGSIGTLYAYSEKSKATGSSVFLRGTTCIDPLSAILFGGEIKINKDSNLIVDEWLKFSGDSYVINLTNELKFFLERCLTQVYERLEVSRKDFRLAGQLDHEDEKVKVRLVRGIVEVLENIERDSQER